MSVDALVQAVTAAAGAAPGGGVVRVDQAGEVLVEAAWGLAERRLAVAMTPQHRLGVASGSKGFTALTVMSLVGQGVLTLDTTARSLLGADLPLIADAVTVGQLLAHRSGIEDYIDDDADAGEYLLSVPVHALVSPEAYLPMLAECRQLAAPDSRFEYCNGGYILLAILAQRASGRPFHDLVAERVLTPAGMTRSGYFRSDDLPADAALGYVEVGGEWRSNVLHLPVIGGGDGGAYTTAADMAQFWRALRSGAILPQAAVERMLTPVSEDEDGWWCGLGFWLNPAAGRVNLNGEDAGVSFSSTHWVEPDIVYTMIGNTADAAWPVGSAVLEALPQVG